MPSEWPLVGRREELPLIEEALVHPEIRGVVLAGEPGVGKTRLAREVLRIAEGQGFEVAWAVGTRSSGSIPFGALAHLLPDEVQPHLQAGQSGGAANLLRAAGESLAARADVGLVLGVDDAHLLDGSSAALLHHLAVTDGAFLVVAVRSSGPTPDAIVSLWKDGLAERVEVQPLSRGETAELLDAALGSQVAETTAHRLWELSRGNPLYLREVVLGGLADGSLAETDGMWRWRGNLAPSARLREVMGSRLAALSPSEREALEAIALGEPLELGFLRSLATPGAVSGLEQLGLLEHIRQERRIKVRPHHPLHGEIVRSQISPTRAADMYREMAEALDETGARRADDLLRVAAWRLEAGAPGRPGLYLQAAQQALALLDYSLAERAARAAVAAEGGFDASHLLAQALVGQGRFEDADHALGRLEADARGDAERARAALTRAHNLSWDLGREEQALGVLAEAERVVSDAALRDELAAAQAYLLTSSGRLDEGIAAGLALLDRPIADGTLVEVLGAAGQGLMHAGRPEEALELLERHLEQALHAVHVFPFAPIAITTYRTTANLFAGRLSEAAAEAEQAHREAMEGSPEWVAAFTGGLLGMMQLVQGQVKSASRHLRQAVVVLKDVDVAGTRHLLQAQLAHALALRGDCAEAERALAEGEAATVKSFSGLIVGWFLLARVWITACRGEVSAAMSEALGAADDLGARGLRTHQAMALHAVARLGHPERVAAPLARVAADSDGIFMPALARHAEAAAATDAVALDRVSEDFEQMGAYLVAAEAAAQSARIHRDEGRTGSALATSTRAARLAEMCEGARTPVLDAVDMDLPIPLTRREREVAALAASGLANQDIASRLVVSVRTVENHLHAAYAKLGVKGRAELGPILGRGHPGPPTTGPE